jgi:hypothetical protein
VNEWFLLVSFGKNPREPRAIERLGLELWIILYNMWRNMNAAISDKT